MKTLKQIKFGNEIFQIVDDQIQKLSNPKTILDSYKNNFKIKNESVDGIGLRNPQIGAYYSVLSHWTNSSEIATVVLPTGTGKTETMLTLYCSERLEKLLVIVPSDPLREQIGNKFLELGLLYKLGILNKYSKTPIVGLLKKGIPNSNDLEDFIKSCNIIVATSSILDRSVKINAEILEKSFTHIFLDEAHHSEASSWDRIRKIFKNKKIVQFTATPFRNDAKRLDGKIIYNYPLRKAQEEKYFKPIKFEAIYEYDDVLADEILAKKGIKALLEDQKKYKHILLARVKTQKRADEVFELYKKLNSKLKIEKIYSGLGKRQSTIIQDKLKNLNIDIIVCVDMLGEGFDLPYLKIAVLHDIRQSLPITLQFIGRFTRTKLDVELGNATVIANLANLEISKELELLYAKDPDWNILLPTLSENRTQQEIDLYNFLEGFKTNDDFPFSLQSLKPALSTVVYKNNKNSWNPLNFKSYFSNSDDFELIRHNYNQDEKVLVIVTAQRVQTDWLISSSLDDVLWNYYIIHWSTKLNLLFINSSDNSGLHSQLAKSIIGDDAEIINGENGGKIFRVLGKIKRFKLQNVGLSEIIGKFIRFVMRVGSDIEPALSKSQLNKAKKSMIYGTGYENGNEISIGCSYKGRIWSRRRNNLPTLINWFNHIGQKINDKSINGDDILKDALVAKALFVRPAEVPFMIDWNEDVYNNLETKYTFMIGGIAYPLYNIDIKLIDPKENGDIKFGFFHEDKLVIDLVLKIFKDKDGNPNYEFKKVNSRQLATVRVGTKTYDIEHYFTKAEVPSIWFVSGNYLEGNNFYELKSIINEFDRNKIKVVDFNGIDLNVESQGYNPKKTNSIQFRMIENLKKGDYDIVFDDDGSGEIADIITLKVDDKTRIKVELYHLKYALKGKTSEQIKNLYEVCAQAQKSINWRFKRSKEFIEHLLRREALRKQKGTYTRYELGDETKMLEILDLVNKRLPLDFDVYIVQPGLDKNKISNDQLNLLSVTESYLLERAAIKLNVISSK